jgi:hypothetical protein
MAIAASDARQRGFLPPRRRRGAYCCCLPLVLGAALVEEKTGSDWQWLEG